MAFLQQHTTVPVTSRPLHGTQPSISDTREMKAKAVDARRAARAEQLDTVPPHLPVVSIPTDLLQVVQPLV